MPDCHIVICKPGFYISTPELFRKLDQVNLRLHPDTAGMLEAIASGDLRECAMRMYNVFEEVPDRRMRTVAEIKSTMRDFGALGAVMTGTGSAVFGVWQDRDAAENCAEELSREYRFCVVSRPTERLNIG
jgi:4-diphosphocytidyl-2-C-methyl-D-erythritol kinase